MLRHAAVMILAVFVLAACAAPPTAPRTPSEALVKLSPSGYPDFTSDTGSLAGLAESVSRSLEYLAKLPPERTIEFGPEKYTAAELSGALSGLCQFLAGSPTPDELDAYIKSNFDVYISAGFDGLGSTLFTGYYTPELAASCEQTDEYRYPLYGVPDDLVTAELSGFGSKCAGDTIRGRVEDGNLVPYYTRAEIDGLGALSGCGLELAWCADPVDIFFLQVQGSGVLRFTDGTSMHANYGGQNGRPYRSIGKLLVDEGKATLSEMSMDWLYSYLHEHPEEVSRVLGYNDSYVFFKLEDTGPYGSLGVPVTPERSIATDKKFMPQGALAFIVTEAPEFAEGCEPVGWKPYSRFVLNQDTGGAITGPGRVDIYFGDDTLAKKRAGNMRRFGEIYFLVGKR